MQIWMVDTPNDCRYFVSEAKASEFLREVLDEERDAGNPDWDICGSMSPIHVEE